MNLCESLLETEMISFLKYDSTKGFHIIFSSVTNAHSFSNKCNYLVRSLISAGGGLMEAHWQRKSNTAKTKEFLKSQIFSKKMKALMSALQKTFEAETLQEVNYLSMVSRLINFFFLFFFLFFSTGPDNIQMYFVDEVY